MTNKKDPKDYAKKFEAVIKYGDWSSLKSLNPPDFKTSKRKFYNEKNARSRDIMSNGLYAGEPEKHATFTDVSYSFAANLSKPQAFRRRYTTDDYLKPVDGEAQAIAHITLQEELKTRGISLKPYGTARQVEQGDQVRICIPVHELTNKVGTVIGQRRNEYLVKVGNTMIWATLNELEAV